MITLFHDKELLGIGHWQRFQQNRIQKRKDAGIGADAEGECEQDNNRKARALAQPSERVFGICPQGFKRSPLPNLAAALFDQGDIAEFAVGGSLRFLPASRRYQISDLFIQMFTDRL
jgi:hypothetical protein